MIEESSPINKMVVETLKKYAPDKSKAMTANEIVEKIYKDYSDNISQREEEWKKKKKKKHYKEQFPYSVGAFLTGTHQGQKEGKVSGFYTKITFVEGAYPRKIYYSGFVTTDRQDAETKEQGKINTKKKEKDSEEKKKGPEEEMRDAFINYLKSEEYGMKRVQKVEHQKSNKYKNNQWIHPDVISVEDRVKGSWKYHKHIKKFVPNADKFNLWSFELKTKAEIESGQLRKCFLSSGQ